MTCRIEYCPFPFHDLCEAFSYIASQKVVNWFTYDGRLVFIDDVPVLIIRIGYDVRTQIAVLTYKSVETKHVFPPKEKTEHSYTDKADEPKNFDIV